MRVGGESDASILYIMLPIQKSPIESFFRFFFIAELNPGQAGLLLSVGNNSPWVRGGSDNAGSNSLRGSNSRRKTLHM